MMTFLKTILIVLLVYLGLKFLIRLATPYLMRYISKKAGQQFEQFFGNNPDMNSQHKPEGSITIDKNPSQNSRKSKKVGEYVEFEEVD
ncbi:DUF4834 family protein [Aequorivita todarodis]|uniref:DUF4834 family protein n=1 Tax=Aequorivita todarodis TaxID=2036821 RepID=UPI0023504A82|nr:DUF4834 family protein [Aequorivita todarodis]MDC8001778.1 DUF4834 family protein [Aequorivita todarodis]